MKKTVTKYERVTTRVEFSVKDIEKMLLEKTNLSASSTEIDWITGDGGVVRSATLKTTQEDVKDIT